MRRSTGLPPLAAEVRQLRALLPQDASPQSTARAREHPVQVFCRFRGASSSEERRGHEAWELGVESPGSVSAVGCSGSNALRFGFDRVFGPQASQADVFEPIQALVGEVLNGVNGAVLCYGQTSAGKTFTMEGEQLNDTGAAHGDLRGVIPRSLTFLFNAAQAEEKTVGKPVYRFHLSMMEIYMERLRDLLDPDGGAELRIIEDRTRGMLVRGLREVVVNSFDMALEVFLCGRSHRAINATGMNDRSSRSHSIFVLKVERLDGAQSGGKLCLVDLAGSECLKKACFRGDDVAAVNSEIVEESKAINQSLSTLGLVIKRLASRRQTGSKDAFNMGEKHIPYRSSRLTHVLKDVLGGNSQTILVINCSLSSLHAAETTSTLRFGARAKSIVNTVQGGPNADTSLLLQTLRAARREIERLQMSKTFFGEGGGALRLSCSSPIKQTCANMTPSPINKEGSRWTLWSELEGRSPSPMRKVVAALPSLRPQSRRASMSAPGSRRTSISPLELTPRSALASRRVSKSAARSLRVSLAPSNADAVSLLDLSPRSGMTSRRVSMSKRASFAGPDVSVLPEEDGVASTEHSTVIHSSLSPPRRRRGCSLPGYMRDADSAGAEEAWDFPLGRQGTLTWKLKCSEREVVHLKEQFESLQHRRSERISELEQHCAALQAANEWLSGERVQYIESALRSSFEESFQDSLQALVDEEEDASAEPEVEDLAMDDGKSCNANMVHAQTELEELRAELKIIETARIEEEQRAMQAEAAELEVKSELETKLVEHTAAIETWSSLEADLRSALADQKQVADSQTAKAASLEAALRKQQSVFDSLESRLADQSSGLAAAQEASFGVEADHRRAIAAWDEKVIDLETAMLEQKTELDAQSAKVADLEAKLAEKSRALQAAQANLDEQRKAMEAHIAIEHELESSLNDKAMEAQVADLAANRVLEAKVLEVAKYKQVIETQSVQLAEQSKAMEVLTVQRKELEATLEKSKVEAQTAMSAAKSELEAQLAAGLKAIETQSVQLAEQSKAMEVLTTQRTELEATLEKSKAEAQIAMSAAKSELEAKLAAEQQVIETQSVQLAEQSKAMEVLTTQRTELEATLEKSKAEAQIAMSAAKSELEAKLAAEQQAHADMGADLQAKLVEQRASADVYVTKCTELESKLDEQNKAMESALAEVARLNGTVFVSEQATAMAVKRQNELEQVVGDQKKAAEIQVNKCTELEAKLVEQHTALDVQAAQSASKSMLEAKMAEVTEQKQDLENRLSNWQNKTIAMEVVEAHRTELQAQLQTKELELQKAVSEAKLLETKLLTDQQAHADKEADLHAKFVEQRVAAETRVAKCTELESKLLEQNTKLESSVAETARLNGSVFVSEQAATMALRRQEELEQALAMAQEEASSLRKISESQHRTTNAPKRRFACSLRLAYSVALILAALAGGYVAASFAQLPPPVPSAGDSVFVAALSSECPAELGVESWPSAEENDPTPHTELWRNENDGDSTPRAGLWQSEDGADSTPRAEPGQSEDESDSMPRAEFVGNEDEGDSTLRAEFEQSENGTDSMEGASSVSGHAIDRDQVESSRNEQPAVEKKSWLKEGSVMVLSIIVAYFKLLN